MNIDANVLKTALTELYVHYLKLLYILRVEILFNHFIIYDIEDANI
jgi:hypothetical protein